MPVIAVEVVVEQHWDDEAEAAMHSISSSCLDLAVVVAKSRNKME